MSSKQIIKNSAIGIIQLILTAVLTLISVPIFIHKLGLELYGIFAIVSVVGNLNLLANFGLNGALLVYIAKQGKCKESDHDIVVTQIIMVGLTLIFTILAIFFSKFIIQDIFKIPSRYFTDSMNLFLLLVFANSILLIGQTYTAIIDATQKIYITNICQFSYSIIYWGGMIIAVLMGGHLTMVGIIALNSAIIWFLLVMFFSRKVWGKLDTIGLKENFKKTAKKQLSYGSKIYIAGLAGFMFEPLSKILLSNFIGLNSVAFFEIGLKVKSQINALIYKAFYPIYPYIANTQSSNILHRQLFDFSKKIQLIVIPLSILLAFILPIILKVWLGPDNLFQNSIFVITLTFTMILFSPPALLIYQYLAAKNMADKNIWVQLTSSIVNIITFFALKNKFGMYSILFSNSLGLFSSYLICLYYQHKYWNVNLSNEINYYLKLLIYGVSITLFCFLIRHFLQVSLFDLMIYPFFIAISFVFFIRQQKLLIAEDLKFYLKYFPTLKKILLKLFV